MLNRKFLGVIAILLVSASACSLNSQWDQTHNHNTGVGNYLTPQNQIIEFPYGWDNVARVCQDGDGVYVAFHGTQVAVVANDPACK